MRPASRQQGAAAAAMALAIVLAMTGCARPAGQATMQASAAPPAQAARQPPAPAVTSPRTDDAPAAVLERVKADLAAREGVPLDSIHVVTTRGVVWRDAAMGCGEPGTSYPLVRIEGFLIVLEQGGRHFEYRARPDGPFVLCRRPANGS